MLDFIDYLIHNKIFIFFVGINVLMETHKLVLEKRFKGQIKESQKPKYVYDLPDFRYDPLDISIDHIKSKEIKEAIEKFKDTLEEKIDKENLNLFYNNLNNVRVMDRTKIKIIGELKKTKAEYDSVKNSINFYIKKDFELIIFHELLHMASSFQERNIAFTGFAQENQHNIIGTGINEGYTEHLRDRLFVEADVAYIFQKFVVEEIEDIIGADKMEKFYFNANLNGLISEMNKYLSLKDTMELINGLDTYTKIDDSIANDAEKEVTRIISRIFELLLKMYLKKIISNTELDEELLYKVAFAYAASLRCIWRKNSIHLSEEQIINIIEEFIKKPKKEI